MTEPTHDQTDDAPNEIIAAAKEAKEHAVAAAKSVKQRSGSWPLKVGLGVGIGSAAIAAAVLFATRDRED